MNIGLLQLINNAGIFHPRKAYAASGTYEYEIADKVPPVALRHPPISGNKNSTMPA